MRPTPNMISRLSLDMCVFASSRVIGSLDNSPTGQKTQVSSTYMAGLQANIPLLGCREASRQRQPKLRRCQCEACAELHTSRRLWTVSTCPRGGKMSVYAGEQFRKLMKDDGTSCTMGRPPIETVAGGRGGVIGSFGCHFKAEMSPAKSAWVRVAASPWAVSIQRTASIAG